MNDRLTTTVSQQAMATEFVVKLPGENAAEIEVAIDALARLSEMEMRLTVYRPDSEISRVNREGHHRPVPVSHDTFSLLSKSISFSQQTAGAFDVTSGPLVEIWGFEQRHGKVPDRDAIAQALSRVGWTNLILDPDAKTVQLRQPDMRLNLGAIGKGHAVDTIAADLQRGGVEHFLVSGGSSSVVACGDSDPGTGEGWWLAVQHPTVPQRRLGGVRLRNAAIGTSGSGNQFFHHRGQRLGHVLDPRTGWPSGNLLALTLIADSATEADAMATAAFVSHPLRGKLTDTDSNLSQYSRIEVAPKPRQNEVAVSRIHLTDQDWRDEPTDSMVIEE